MGGVGWGLGGWRPTLGWGGVGWGQICVGVGALVAAQHLVTGTHALGPRPIFALATPTSREGFNEDTGRAGAGGEGVWGQKSAKTDETLIVLFHKNLFFHNSG